MADIQDMIREEISSIENLKERVIFKELMEGVFLSLYETNQRMYQSLEARVMGDLEYEVNHYLIKTGMIERAYLDQSHQTMAPMDDSDILSMPCKVSDIREGIEKEGKFRLMKGLLLCDYLEIKKIWELRESFAGTLEAGGAWNISVTLEQNRDYIARVKHLYQLFVKNGVPWQTVNAPYIYKLVDVCLYELPEGVPDGETVRNIKIDFGELEGKLKFDLAPVWNIRRLQLDSVGFPVPCEDHKNFEHTISIREYGLEHAYLVEEDAGIQSVRQQGEKLLITGEVEAVKKWDIYMISRAGDKKIDRFTYPVLQNLRREDFAECYQMKFRQKVKTRAELTRFVSGFGLEDYLEYRDCEITGRWEEDPETYSMNDFIEDEIRDKRDQKKMTLYFQSKSKAGWLTRDLASFLTSEVQELFPEYECGGRLL